MRRTRVARRAVLASSHRPCVSTRTPGAGAPKPPQKTSTGLRPDGVWSGPAGRSAYGRLHGSLCSPRVARLRLQEPRAPLPRPLACSADYRDRRRPRVRGPLAGAGGRARLLPPPPETQCKSKSRVRAHARTTGCPAMHVNATAVDRDGPSRQHCPPCGSALRLRPAAAEWKEVQCCRHPSRSTAATGYLTAVDLNAPGSMKKDGRRQAKKPLKTLSISMKINGCRERHTHQQMNESERGIDCQFLHFSDFTCRWLELNERLRQNGRCHNGRKVGQNACSLHPQS